MRVKINENNLVKKKSKVTNCPSKFHEKSKTVPGVLATAHTCTQVMKACKEQTLIEI